jgi:hypothetical protein
MDERQRDCGLGLTGCARDQNARRDCHAAPDQPLSQPLARPGQPAPDGDFRKPELIRRRGIRQPLQIAKDDGAAQPFGQAVDLLVQDLRIRVILCREIAFGGPLCDRFFERVPSGRGPLTAMRHPLGHAEQPARDRLHAADGPGPVGQHQKDGLKGILRIVGVAEYSPADPEYHRAVSDHQFLEGRFRVVIAPRDESVQELRIGHRPDRTKVEQPVRLPVNPSYGRLAIASDLLGRWSPQSSARLAVLPHEDSSRSKPFCSKARHD